MLGYGTSRISGIRPVWHRNGLDGGYGDEDGDSTTYDLSLGASGFRLRQRLGLFTFSGDSTQRDSLRARSRQLSKGPL
ncbi:hypothetical protein VUR80DRAFT_8903 [Thermomyces stellatus]